METYKKLEYEGVLFAYNPVKYSVSLKRDVYSSSNASGGFITQLGSSFPRQIKGTGIFLENEEEYENLKNAFHKSPYGKLTLPHGEDIYVYFLSLTLRCDGEDDTMFYEFEFLEKEGA